MSDPVIDTESAQPGAELTTRVDALTAAIELAQGRLPEAEVDSATAIVLKASERLRHGTDHTVVAVGGATGSGKSTIVNRLAGAELSDSSVRRPTTSITHAVVWGTDDAGPLLDWLDVRRRYQIDDGEPGLAGLVLLDLPDHDSTAVAHRMEVDRLVDLVDAFLWVTDPQKYADEALHAGYIKPLANHAGVLRFVLNQIDLLDDHGSVVAADLSRLLVEDGVVSPSVVSVSALTGEGFDRLAGLLVVEVGERRVAVERLRADIAGAASSMNRGGHAIDPNGRSRDRLIEGLAEAAGAEPAAAVAAAHHRRQGSLAMGWPFTRFIRRMGRKPLADLPGPGRAAAAEPRADLALRDYAEEVSESLERPWPSQVRAAALSERDPLLDDLRRTVGRATVGDRPGWWSAVAWLQRVLAVIAVVGLTWLLIVAVLGGFFRFDTDPLLPDTPGVDWAPLPSVLLIGGSLLGLVISMIARFPLSVGAARRGRAARKQIAAQVQTVADERVVAPVIDECDTHVRLGELLELAGA